MVRYVFAAAAWGMASQAGRELGAMDCDMTLDRILASAFASINGLDAFMAELERKSGCELDLYSVSTEWTRDESVTVLKAKGTRGDLLVNLA